MKGCGYWRKLHFAAGAALFQALQLEVQHDLQGQSAVAKGTIWIERFWRTIKYDYFYINPMDDDLNLR